jgi:GNAT superfamily N-acetyltransferase
VDIPVRAGGTSNEPLILNLAVRSATLEDAHAIAALLLSIPHYGRFQELGIEALQAKVAQNILRSHDQQMTLVAETDTGVVGYAVVYWIGLLFAGPEGYVSELFVHTAASGQGIGTALLKHIESEAKTRGCRRLTLMNAADTASYKRQFYAKQGWLEDPDAVRFSYDLR